MKNIAICILTRNHPEVIAEVLPINIDVLRDLGIDVYYFDSSDNDETKRIVEMYSVDYNNLFYIGLNNSISFGDKVLTILKNEKLVKEYKYLWPIKDRVYFHIEHLVALNSLAEGDFDALIMDIENNLISDDEEGYCEEVYDLNFLYTRCGSYITSIDTVLYGQRIIGSLNDEVLERYGACEWMEHWAHYFMTFYLLAALDNPRVGLLCGKKMLPMSTDKGKSSWYGETFEIWVRCWVDVNSALPDIYNNRDYVIKRTSNLPWILGSVERMQGLHDNGYLDAEVYEWIKDRWSQVSTIPLDVIKGIAYGIYDIYHDISCANTENNRTVDLIIQLEHLICENKVTADQALLSDIMSAVVGEIMEEKKFDERREALFKGVLMDVMSEIEASDYDIAEIRKLLHMAVVMIMISK